MSFKNNVLANCVGQGWSAMLNLALVPVYIEYLGIEAYGLIGFFASLQVWLGLLDMGLTPTLNREVVRFGLGVHASSHIRDLLRSIEYLYLAVSGVVILILISASAWVASHWLNVQKLSLSEVSMAVAIMAVVLILRWWEGLYRSAIQGMQRMVWLNAAQAILATLRGVGAVLVLVLVSPTITVFFIWQCLISLLSVILLASKTYRCLPSPDHQATFSLDALRPTWRFAAGMLLTSILALALTQIDKILLSNLLPLEQFGYYTVASTAAAVVGLIAYPISQAAFPRLTELASSGNEESLIRTYHTVCQWISVLAIPPAMTLAFFAAPVLRLWTQQSDLAQSAAPMLIPLAIGNLLNTFMIVPCVLQVAHGRAGLVARLNLVAVVIMVPIIFLLVPLYGAAAAAWIWVALNMGYVLLAIPLMHRDVIPSARARWYTDDLLKPLLIGILISIGAFSVSSMNGNRVFEIVQLSIIVALATVLCGVSSSYPRASIYSFVRKLRKDTHA